MNPNRSATGDFSLPEWAQDASGRTICVLGADGFIGNRVVLSALHSEGGVTAICAREPWRLEGVASPRLEVERVVGGTWWSSEAIDRLADRMRVLDAVIFLYYRPPRGSSEADRQREELDYNATVAVRVARAAAEAGVRFVFASSADVYGPWHDEPVAEDVVPRPASPYARAKLEAERVISEVSGAGNFCSLRLGTVYGPGENGPRAIPSFIRAFTAGAVPVVHGDGADTRDYVHVDDVATSLVNAALVPHIDGVLNIGSGVGRTTLEVLAAVAAAVDADPEARHVTSHRRPSRLILDARRAEASLAFESRSDFGYEVEKEAAWLRQLLARSA